MVPAHHINTLEVAASVKRQLFLGVGLAGALVLTACAGSDRGSETSSSGAAATGSGAGLRRRQRDRADRPIPNGQIIFGAAGAPSMFDPLYATDGETFRVVRQMTEGLVGFKPGTADVEPALAESWEQSAGRPDLDVQDPRGREVPRRHRRRRRGRLLQPRPDVHPDRRRRDPGQYWSDNMGGFKGQVDETGAPVPACTSPARPTATTR